MRTCSRFVIALVGLVLAFGGEIKAQGCPGNDGFSAGQCCTPAQPNLPQFPTVQLAGLGACIKDCTVESQYNTGTLIQPQQVLCDYWIFNVQISAAGFAVGGMLAGKYARTWTEFAPNAQLQVWRFLVNGDLNYVASGPLAGAGCPIPFSALPPYNYPVWFIGSIDFALNCQTGQWQFAYNLSHLCPTEVHAAYSTRYIAAAAGWPRRTYHFVGPANFSFAGTCAPPQGQIFAESVRASILNPAAPYICLNESQVNQGGLGNQFNDCFCYTPGGIVPPARYHHQTLQAMAMCAGLASPITSIPVPAPGPIPTGLRALTLGSYIPTAAAQTYPGQECVSVYIGLLQYQDICNVVPNGIHIVAGVGTTGGFPAMLFDAPMGMVTQEFLDLSNVLVITTAGFQPGFGSLYVSDLVFNFNTL